MRKIIVQEFITLDGIMQAPGGPDEDAENNFTYGGWTAPYFHDADQEANALMEKWLKSTDLLLGKKTYDIFAGYWPEHADMWPGINDVAKYVVSDVSMNPSWQNSTVITGDDVVAQIKALKESGDTDLQVIGSGNLVQTLLKNDLVDELRLMTFPITLGAGKRLFEDGTIAAAFTMGESFVASNGVIYASYLRAGNVETGTVG